MGMGAGLAHIRSLVYRPASPSVQRRLSKKGTPICIFPRGQGKRDYGTTIYIVCHFVSKVCHFGNCGGCQGCVRGVEWGGLGRGPPSLRQAQDRLYLPPRTGEEGLEDTSICIMCVILGHFVAGSLLLQTVAERFCLVGLCLLHEGMIVLMFGMCQGAEEPEIARRKRRWRSEARGGLVSNQPLRGDSAGLVGMDSHVRGNDGGGGPGQRVRALLL